MASLPGQKTTEVADRLDILAHLLTTVAKPMANAESGVLQVRIGWQRRFPHCRPLDALAALAIWR